MTLTPLAPAALDAPAVPPVPAVPPAAPAPAVPAAPASPAGKWWLDDLDSATRASAAAHEATRALTDTVMSCQRLPAEIYQYAPYLSQCLAAVTAASRTLATVTGRAMAVPGPSPGSGPGLEHLHAVRQATAALDAATTDLRGQTAALATAVAWYTEPAALASTASTAREPRP